MDRIAQQRLRLREDQIDGRNFHVVLAESEQ